MAVKKIPLEEIISVKAETVPVYSYADFFAGKSLFASLQIQNAGSENVSGLRLVVTASGGLLVTTEKPIEELPYESRVHITAVEALSPHYFVNKTIESEEEVCVSVYADKKLICESKHTVKVLPIDFWQGLSGDAALMSCFRLNSQPPSG